MFEIRRRGKVIEQETFADKIKKARQALTAADAVVIGAGAGLSTAGGIAYSGKRFDENFKDFIEKYGMTDMYTAGFYPFQTEEEKWAYWSRHIRMNRYDAPVGEVYKQLLALVSGKPYFVITTNVDAQFYRAGFDTERVWAVQGDYGKLQCAEACHNTLYDNHDAIMEMTERQTDCRIPSELVPRCPRCGEHMEVNIRKDRFFVEDQQWHDERGRYERFLNELKGKKVVFLELGVGFNTPTIIRLPFEKMTESLPGATLVRVNLSYPELMAKIEDKSVLIAEDIGRAVKALLDGGGAA